MKARNGKVARLPLEIRERLNARLSDGEPGNRLVEWLNSNPDVIKVMAEQFEGRPITEQNISEWRAGGYEEWLTLHDFLDETRVLSENSGELVDTGISSDHLHIVLLAHHAHLLQNLGIMPEDEFNRRLKAVTKLTASIMKMRRDELQKARLELQRERHEFLREKESLKSVSSAKAAKTASPSSTRARSADAKKTATAPVPSRPDIQPSPESPGDEIAAPPPLTLHPKAAPKIPFPTGRIQPEFLEPGVELPALRDWLDSVGFGQDPRLLGEFRALSSSKGLSKPQAKRAETAAGEKERGKPASPNPIIDKDRSDSIRSILIQPSKLAA